MGLSNLSPLLLSLKVAGLATLFNFFAGLLVARMMSIRVFRGKEFLHSLLLLPLVLPPTVVGFLLLFLFGKNGWIGGWLWSSFQIQIVFTWIGAVLASIVVAFPLMYQSALAGFETVDSQLENAARTLGASEWRVFWSISLPLAWPGLLSGLILSFTRALGEFGATLMIAGYIPGKTDTMPIAIYFLATNGEMGEAGIWVFIMILLALGSILGLELWTKKKMRRFTAVREEEKRAYRSCS
ncbi:putative molybdenum transport permease [[Clostridium] ultunense Esp]|nr:putative molybdenum transport permease [[Clostridium] ultunense Esp]